MRAALISSAIAIVVLASPAAHAATVVGNSCEDLSGSPTDNSLGDGNTDRCLFNGNINGNVDPLNSNSFLNAQAAYNALPLGDISLNFITKSDDANFRMFGSITGDGTTNGTFSLPGFQLSHLGIKAGNQFYLYQLSGESFGSWTTSGLNNRQGQARDLSHIAFFGGSSAVPEPSTWMIMLLGFGFVGGTMRFAKRKQKLTASYS